MKFSPKIVVKVSRFLSERTIKVFVTDTEIGAELSLDDFLAEVAQRISMGFYTKARLAELLRKNAAEVQLLMQKEVGREQ